MKLNVLLEYRFLQAPDQSVWTQTMFGYPFWTRYLDVFDEVTVVARAQRVDELPAGCKQVDGPSVAFNAVPHYVGPAQYLLHARSVARATRTAVLGKGAVIMRTPSTLANCAEPALHRIGRPYGVEVVGDPYDTFAPGSVHHQLRPFFRWWFSRRLRRQCAAACAASYVTKEALQRRYPPSPNAYFTHYSSIELRPEGFVPRARRVDSRKDSYLLIFVGTLEQMYKAPDVLIEAVAQCVQKGIDLRAVIVGDGKHRSELENQANALGLNDRVVFRGQLPAGEAIRHELDKADLFVLPSRQEGLPRAMIEAMARALPCVGSTVGGIPELLPPEEMVAAGDAGALAQKISEILTDPARMTRMSIRNLEKASEYAEQTIRIRRAAFYSELKAKTERWLERRKPQ